MLNEPKLAFNLTQASGGPGKESVSSSSQDSPHVNAICMDFPEDETDKFYVGSEDYNIYECNLHSQAQSHID
jgi:hypothetical protein